MYFNIFRCIFRYISKRTVYILSKIYHWHRKVVMGGDLSSLYQRVSLRRSFMQIAIAKPSPWWPFRSNIVLFVLRIDAYISMTSHKHVRIVYKIEILINLTGIVHCTLMKPSLNWFYRFIISPQISQIRIRIFHITRSVFGKYLQKIKHRQPNTNTNANQVQMQRQIPVRFENDWNHRV